MPELDDKDLVTSNDIGWWTLIKLLFWLMFPFMVMLGTFAWRQQFEIYPPTYESLSQFVYWTFLCELGIIMVTMVAMMRLYVLHERAKKEKQGTNEQQDG